MRAVLVAIGTAAGSALTAGGYYTAEQFKPTVAYVHALAEARQVPGGNVGCTRLDTIDAAIQQAQDNRGIAKTPGQLDAIALPNDPGACWQVNGVQVPRSQAARCNTLDAIAAALVGARRAADGIDYVSARWVAVKLSDPAACWQTEATLSIPMTCTAD
jgi:hypothetical protein